MSEIVNLDDLFDDEIAGPGKEDPGYWDEMRKKSSVFRTSVPQKHIKTPEQMWKYACEYFEWCNRHKLKKVEYIKSGAAAGTTITIKLPRAYTWQGFQTFLIEKNMIKNVKMYFEYPEFKEVMNVIASVMFSQKYEYALIGVFNPNLVARELGLIEKTENTSTVKQLTASVDYTLLSESTLEELAKHAKIDPSDRP